MAVASVYDFDAIGIDGERASLDAYRGRVMLIVNTASGCGFTPQFAGLESLRQRYREQGLVILGFPSNEFGGQDPGTDEEISMFCTSEYRVSFPMMSKGNVNGGDAQPFRMHRSLGRCSGWQRGPIGSGGPRQRLGAKCVGEARCRTTPKATEPEVVRDLAARSDGAPSGMGNARDERVQVASRGPVESGAHSVESGDR